MAPAAKLKQNGKHCKIQFENKIVKKPNIGSTIPDNEPIKMPYVLKSHCSLRVKIK